MICVKCKVFFPSTMIINNKRRGLNHRKYCLQCSPFAKHNTRKLHLPNGYLVCTLCGKFYNQLQRRNRACKEICGACVVKKFRKRRKEYAIEYKGGKCKICGYDKCIEALVFHHKNKENKGWGISLGLYKSIDKLEKELDKCSLLCCRCHAEVHYKITKKIIGVEMGTITERLRKVKGSSPFPRTNSGIRVK